MYLIIQRIAIEQYFPVLPFIMFGFWGEILKYDHLNDMKVTEQYFLGVFILYVTSSGLCSKRFCGTVCALTA